jgi:peroxiredoxin Q/BCP
MKTRSTFLFMSFLAFFGLQAARSAEIGQEAPLLSAVSDEGKTVNFADAYKKGVTLVYFYPKADTPGCTAEACSLRDNFDALQAKGLQIIGVSEDKADAQKSFKEKYHLPFALIADSDGKVAKAFGVPTLLGFAKRQSFLVKNGKIVWRDLSVSPKSHVEEVTKALESLPH